MKNKWLLLSMGALLVYIIYSITIMGVRINQYSELIYPGIYINNIEVSGLTRDEARTKITKEFMSNLENKKLTIKADDYEFETNYEALGVKLDFEQAIDSAMDYGKTYNFIIKHKIIRNPKKTNFNIIIKFNDQMVDKIINEIEDKINIKPIDAKIEHLGNGRFKITSETIGRKLNAKKLIESIYSSINSEKEDYVVVKGIMEEIVPKIFEADLKTINSRIISFSTSFNNSSEARENNIKIATAAINGTLLMPGEVFSFNKIVGKTTIEKGYQSAKVIVGTEFVDDIGGGICQVSSTLYNAILRSELTVIERKNHSQPISYVPLGQDAMIFYGASDLKFLNNTDFPIWIEGFVKESSVCFNLYSNEDMNGFEYKLESKIVQTIKPKINIIYDPYLSSGETIVEKEGKNGFVVELYKYVFSNNELIKKELLSKSKYNSSDKIMRAGR